MSRAHWTRPTAAESARMIEYARDWADEDWGDEPVDAGDVGTWTVAEMRRAASAAVSRTRTTRASAREVDLHGAAFSGVGMAVAADPRIEWGDAVYAGQAELWSLTGATRAEAGHNADWSPRKHVHMYWTSDELDRFPDPTAPLTRLALAKVLDALDERHRSVLLAWAVTEDADRAGELLGCHPVTLGRWLRDARRAALQLWFDEETPPDLSRLPIRRKLVKTHCPSGHELLGDNVGRKHNKGRNRVRCKQCARDAYYRQKEVQE